MTDQIVSAAVCKVREHNTANLFAKKPGEKLKQIRQKVFVL